MSKTVLKCRIYPDTTETRRSVILLSGKRKSGKDFVAERLLPALGGEDAVVVRLSGPLKKCYAEEHNLGGRIQILLEIALYRVSQSSLQK